MSKGWSLGLGCANLLGVLFKYRTMSRNRIITNNKVDRNERGEKTCSSKQQTNATACSLVLEFLPASFQIAVRQYLVPVSFQWAEYPVLSNSRSWFAVERNHPALDARSVPKIGRQCEFGDVLMGWRVGCKVRAQNIERMWVWFQMDGRLLLYEDLYSRDTYVYHGRVLY